MLLRELIRAIRAQTVQNGAAAVHAEAVVGGYMGQKLLADGAFQMNELPAGHTLEMEMAAAISPTHVLVHVGGLGIAAVFPRQALVAQLGEVAIHRTFSAGLAVLLVHLGTKLLHRKLAVRPTLQKIQQALSPRRLIYPRHGIPPLGTDSCSIQV